MEYKILDKLNWKLVRTTHLQLLALVATEQDGPVITLSKYLIELAIHKGLSRSFKQSTVVAASVSLAESVLRRKLPANDIRRQFNEP